VVGGSVAGKHVLFVVPHEDLSVPDYDPVVRRLTAAGVRVDTASTATTECRGFKGKRTGVTPKYLVTEIRPADYAGVLFCGADVSEYTRDPSSAAYAAVDRIIREMSAERKVVAAICLGQNVLWRFKVIPTLRPGVITLDCVVTAKDPNTEWSQFTDAVLAALAK
jgi:putative intracellular protease/amidase